MEPTAPHSIESLAALAHFSPFHFHRLYRALTGENVAATVRRVRISQAAHRLGDTEVSVTQAALDAGYDSSQSFARAFRDLTGLSPSDFRASQHEFVAGQPEVTIVDRPSMTVLGLSHEGPPATIPHCYRRVRQWAADHNLDWTTATRVGVGYGDPEQGEDFTYFAGLVLPDEFVADGEIERRRVPGGRYATHRLVGPHVLIGPTFQTLFGGWLMQSGMEPDDRPVIELYHSNGARPEGTPPVTDLFIPIREEMS